MIIGLNLARNEWYISPILASLLLNKGPKRSGFTLSLSLSLIHFKIHYALFCRHLSSALLCSLSFRLLLLTIMDGSCLSFKNPIRDAISRIRFAPTSNNLLISSWDSVSGTTPNLSYQSINYFCSVLSVVCIMLWVLDYE